jgi:hypothetical protein
MNLTIKNSELPPESELRRNKINLLKSNLVTKQNSLFSLCKQSDLATEASFLYNFKIIISVALEHSKIYI